MSFRAKETPPSLDEFQNIADTAWAELPSQFRDMCGSVLLRVEDWPSEEVLMALGITEPYELTGLYEGVSLTQKSHLDAPDMDIVTLYRRPLLDEWRQRGDVSLGELIRHVIIHEIGHHFGLSDDDMHRIEDSA